MPVSLMNSLTIPKELNQQIPSAAVSTAKPSVNTAQVNTTVVQEAKATVSVSDGEQKKSSKIKNSFQNHKLPYVAGAIVLAGMGIFIGKSMLNKKAGKAAANLLNDIKEEVKTKADDAVDALKDKVDDVAKKAEKVAQEAGEKVEAKVETAAQTAQEVVAKTEAKAETAAQTVQKAAEKAEAKAETAAQTVQKAAEKAEAKAETTAQAVQKAAEKAEAKAETTAQTAQEVVAKTEAKAETAAQTVQQAAEKAETKAETTAQTAQKTAEKAEAKAETAAQTVQQAAEKAETKPETTAQTAQKTAEKAEAKAETAAQTAQKPAEKVETKANKAVKTKPSVLKTEDIIAFNKAHEQEATRIIEENTLSGFVNLEVLEKVGRDFADDKNRPDNLMQAANLLELSYKRAYRKAHPDKTLEGLDKVYKRITEESHDLFNVYSQMPKAQAKERIKVFSLETLAAKGFEAKDMTPEQFMEKTLKAFEQYTLQLKK